MCVTIAVIIPVYNVEKYLVQCLESVIGQSVPFNEVILVNDGSTDNSLQICEKYALSYKNFKLLNQENKGLSVSRNRGIDCAESEYITFLDSDDYLDINTVMILHNELRDVYYDVVYFDGTILCEDGYKAEINVYDRSDAELDRIQMTGWEYFSKCYPKKYSATACMSAYRKQTLDRWRIRFPEGVDFEDNYFSFVLVKHAENVIHIPEKLYFRRYRKNSITTSEYSEKKLRDHVQIGCLIWAEISASKEGILRKSRDLIIQYINDYFAVVLEKWRLYTNQGNYLSTDTERVLEKLIVQYLWILDKLDLCSTKEIYTRNKVLDSLDKMLIWNIGDNNKIKKLIRDIVETQKALYITLFRNLPFRDEKCRVGIYGMGKHTEGLLSIYEKIMGKIICDLIFVDSYKDSGFYHGKEIKNYRQINDDLHIIVISSYLFEREMIDNVRSVDKTVPIYSFYHSLKEDVFSQYASFLKYYRV